MIYSIIRTNLKNNGEIDRFEILEEVSCDEYQDFINYFNFLSAFCEIRDLYEICVDSFSELTHHISSSNLKYLLTEAKMSPNKIGQIANRLLLNYCSAMYLFVNKTPQNLKQYVDENLVQEHFVKKTNDMYDNPLDRSYCFFSKLRNHIIHYRLPFSLLIEDIETGYKLLISKDNLLTDNRWGPAKEVVLQLNDTIMFSDLLERCSVLLTVLYYQAIFCFSTIISDIDKKISLFQKKHAIKYFNFAEYDSVESLKQGHFSIRPVPWDIYGQLIREIQKIPGITINYLV